MSWAGGTRTVIDGQDTSTGDTTENVGTSTLEERSDTLSSHDLSGSIEGALVLDGLEFLVRFVLHMRNLTRIYVPHQMSSSCDDG